LKREREIESFLILYTGLERERERYIEGEGDKNQNMIDIF
jgi:hypothetical protein